MFTAYSKEIWTGGVQGFYTPLINNRMEFYFEVYVLVTSNDSPGAH